MFLKKYQSTNVFPLEGRNTIKDNVRKLILGISVFVFAVTVLNLIGWWLDIPILTSYIPEGKATMKVNTSLSLMLIGVGIYLLEIGKKPSGILLITGAFFIGMLTIVEYRTGLNLGIDDFIFPDKYSEVYPGRMSEGTSFSFLFLSLAAFLNNSKYQVYRKSGRVIAIFSLLLGMVGLVSFLLGIPVGEKVFFISTMAIHTSLLVILISVQLLLFDPESIFYKLVTSELSGSRLIRYYLPISIILPVVLSYILIKNIDNNLISYSYGINLHTISLIAISIFYIAVLAWSFNKSDEKQKELNEELEKKNLELKQYKHGLDAAAIVAITNRKGEITYVNEKFCEISKYSAEELIGKTHHIVNSGYHSKDFFKDLWKTIGNGKVWTGEIRNRAKDGSIYWVLTSIVPFYDTTGNIHQYFSIRRDITAMKELEMDVERKNIELEKVNGSLNDFNHMVSHDLKSPLSTLNSIASLIDIEIARGQYESLGEWTKEMKNQTIRLGEFVNHMLVYSRLGQDRGDVGELKPEDIIAEIASALGITLSDTIVFNTPLPILKMSKTKITQIFQNLISNAKKYAKETEKLKIHIGFKAENGKKFFYVQDNGIGILEGYHERIFRMFKVIKIEGKDQTGVGLPIIKKIVENHGGEVWLESEPDKGSTFYFCLSDLYICEMPGEEGA